jgi:type I restriction enzyme S subunit
MDFAQAELEVVDQALNKAIAGMGEGDGRSRPDWVETTLGEICEINPPIPRRAGGLPETLLVSFVPMAAVDSELGAIVAPQLRPVAELQRGLRSFREGDVLMARISPSMENGKAAIAENLANGWGFGSTELNVLRPLAGIPPELILAFLRRRAFRDEAAAQMTGKAGRKRVPVSFLEQHPCAQPPPVEQEELAAQVKASNAELRKVRARVDRVSATLEECRGAILEAGCLGRLTGEAAKVGLASTSPEGEVLPPIPSGWKWSPIGAISERLQYGTSARSGTEGAAGVLYIGMGNLRRGKIAIEDPRHIALVPDQIEKFRLLPGDVLFNRTNSPALVGKAALVEGDIGEAVFASYLIRIQVNREIASPAFLTHWINSPWGREWAGRVKRDAIGQSNINSRELRTMLVPMPPLPAQLVAGGRIDELLARCEELEERAVMQARRIESFGDFLLEQAFEGTLARGRTSEAAMEAAAVQLARARIEQGAEPAAPVPPAAEPTPQPRRQAKAEPERSPRERLLSRIAEIDRDSFGFDELRRGLDLGYEELVALLFSLLEDPRSGLGQGFDSSAAEMRLRRAGQ